MIPVFTTLVSSNYNRDPHITVPTTFQELEAMTLERYSGNPIISYQSGTWKGRQVHYPFVIENPQNSDELIMYYGGGSVHNQDYSIGRATAKKSDPHTWTEYSGNPVLNYSTYGNGPLLGPHDIIWNSTANRFEMFTTTYSTNLASSWQGRYYSNDGITWTYQGVVLGPTGDEVMLGDSGYIRDGNTIYMYYTYRTASAVLPGIRVASSTDGGITWTKHGDVVSKGSSASDYDGQYIEGLQAFKMGDTYVLNYGCSRNVGGTITYSGAYASSLNPVSGFVKSSVNPFFQRSSSGWDSTQISTAVFCRLTDPWKLIYQGTNSVGDYNLALWSMGIATLKM